MHNPWCAKRASRSPAKASLGKTRVAASLVLQPSLEELHELYELGVVLEPLATEIAAKELCEDDLAALEKTLVHMRDATPSRIVELGEEFHGRINRSTG